jgi:hypothetical protein
MLISGLKRGNLVMVRMENKEEEEDEESSPSPQKGVFEGWQTASGEITSLVHLVLYFFALTSPSKYFHIITREQKERERER